MSQATIGAPQRLIASIAAARRLARRAREAGAEDRVDDRARALQPGRRGRRAARRRRAPATSTSKPHRRAGAAPRPARRRRCCPCRRGSGPGPAAPARRRPRPAPSPAASISSPRGLPAPRSPSGRPRGSPRRRRGARARTPSARLSLERCATAAAKSREWVSEMSTAPARGGLGGAPESAHGRRLAGDAPRSRRRPKPPLRPSALTTASFAAKRAARWRPGRARAAAYRARPR